MAEEKKREKKKKKDRVDINLPNARRSIKRSREMRQLRTDYEDMWQFIGGILVVLIIVFILMGGINQGAAFRTLAKWAQDVGNAIAGFFAGGEVNLNENGIYWIP